MWKTQVTSFGEYSVGKYLFKMTNTETKELDLELNQTSIMDNFLQNILTAYFCKDTPLDILTLS